MAKKTFDFGFTMYMLYKSIDRMKFNSLKKKNPLEAERFLYEKLGEMSRDMLKKNNVSTRVKGLENLPDKPCIFIASNAEEFDFILHYAFINKPVGIMIEREISDMAFVGEWLKLAHAVFVDGDGIKQSVSFAMANVKKGISMVLLHNENIKLEKIMNAIEGECRNMGTKKTDIPIVPIEVKVPKGFLSEDSKEPGAKAEFAIHEPSSYFILGDKERKETYRDIMDTFKG